MITRKLLFISLLLYSLPALSGIIQRTITIDAALSGGGTSDWKTPTDITGNSGQFSSDAEGDKQTGTAADLDYQIDSSGRDLKTFAYTYDSAFLYLWIERFASTSNTTDRFCRSCVTGLSHCLIQRPEYSHQYRRQHGWTGWQWRQHFVQ